MAYTTIDKPSDYFNTVLYTGNGSTNAITGVGHQPDLVWIKDRTVGFDHVLQDSVRGTTKIINSNQNYAEFTNANSITSFNSDGFTTGSYVATNQNTTPYVAWNWKAGGTASSNTDGSITSNVSANTTAGFSIVSYSGTGTLGTVGHGLGVTPEMIILRKRNTAENWLVYHEATGNTGATLLNTTTAFFADNMWNSTSPTSSVFTVNSVDGANGSGGTYIAYCFAEKKGFSKFGSYTGNGSTDGTFVYTGFKPAFLIVKSTDLSQSWQMSDNKRDTFNVVSNRLRPNESSAESTSPSWVDFNSQGFKFRHQDIAWNGSGNSYIYMCFSENPFVTSTGIPTTAR